MDYEALERVVAVSPSCWNELQVKQWLEFVHLHPLIPAFSKLALTQPPTASTDPPSSNSPPSTSPPSASPTPSSSANLCAGSKRGFTSMSSTSIKSVK